MREMHESAREGKIEKITQLDWGGGHGNLRDWIGETEEERDEKDDQKRCLYKVGQKPDARVYKDDPS